MTNWFGWAGAALYVDLTTGMIEKKSIDREWAVKNIGGLGFGSSVLFDQMGPEIDPLSPESIITIAQGPLSGTLSPAAGRVDMVVKSPLTGIFLRSNLGGFFGPELKWAGYDLIVIRGRAARPAYLWIKDDIAELRDASHLWGQDTWATEGMLREELRDHNVKVLKIGPGGEHQAFGSAVIGDLGRAAGKCSAAAIWGAKNLKAVAVRGTKGVGIAEPDELVTLSKTIWARFKEDPMYASHTKYGTNTWVGDTVMKSMGGISPRLSSEVFCDLYEKNLSCSGCGLHCSHWYKIKEGKYAGTEGEGLEGNTQLVGFDMGVGADFACYYNNLCNKLGMDTMHPGAAIEWALRLYKDGVITKADTDGIEIVPGNEDGFIELVKKMAYREGFGAVLDSFPLRAAQQIGRGADLYVCQNKGYPCPGSGFMSSIKTTLAHAVATRAHDHLTGSPGIEAPNRQPEMTNEVLESLGRERYGDPTFFTDIDYTARPKYALRVWETENLFCLADMTGTCKFAGGEVLFAKGIRMDDYARLLTAVTGEKFTAEGLTTAAEREMCRQRAFNAREGIRRVDDYPFAYSWMLRNGRQHPKLNYARIKISVEDYGKLLDEYYRLRGCDLATGIPTRKKLESLGLQDVTAELDRRGILPETASL